MKKLTFFLLAAAVIGLTACGGMTLGNSNDVDSDTIFNEADLEVADDYGAPGLIGDSTFVGIIGDGSTMHNLVLYSYSEEGNDTVTFIIDEDSVDKTNCHGIIEGSLCQVEFSGELDKKPKVTYIETPKTYADAIGRWTCDDPENPGKKIGVELRTKGIAVGINNKYLPVKAWKLFNDEAEEITLVIDKGDVEEELKASIMEGKNLTIENDSKVYVKE